jgi:Tol biopolymer transport system component
MMPAETPWNFASFNRDGSKLLTVSGGVLTLRDPESGASLGNVTTGGSSSHPDFAPAGDRIVYVREGDAGSDWNFGAGSLVTQTFDDATNTFGGETPLVTSAGENNYYPSFSPDGQWVLFNRANQPSYNAANAELWVVKVDGTVGPIKLDASNIGPGLTNSWARWAPFEATYGTTQEPVFWLTFSSKRDFGVRLVGVGRPQLWMTPYFPERAAAGMDPTAPAFRLPFQDIMSNNHIAQWTEEVIPVN